MKLLRWGGTLLALLVLLYVVAAFVTPPTHFETRFDVKRPVDVVWRVFTDESRAGEWLDGLRSIDTISGKPLEPGSRFRLEFDEGGREIVLEEELLRVAPERELAFRMTHTMMTSQVVVRFESHGGHTVVLTDNEVRGRGPFKPLIPLFESSMLKRQLEQYERLKGVIEAEPQAEGAEPQEHGESDEGGED